MLKMIWDRISYYNNPVKYYKKKGALIGKGTKIMGADFGSEPWLINIGEGVLLSNKVTFITHDGATWVPKHMQDAPPQFHNDEVHKYGFITIKNNSMIGYGSIIMPGITIGECSIVGAGSVVTKDVLPHTVVAGNPARFICTIEEYNQNCLNKNLDWNHNNYKKNKKEEVLRVLNNR